MDRTYIIQNDPAYVHAYQRPFQKGSISQGPRKSNSPRSYPSSKGKEREPSQTPVPIILKRKEKPQGNQGDACLKSVVRIAPLQDVQNLHKSRSSRMKELSVKAAASRAQISTQNVHEYLIGNIIIDEETLQAGMTRLLPPEEKRFDTSSIKIDDQ